MTADSRFAGYVAVLRKHLVVLTTSVVLVVAAGSFYLWRQPVLFESDVLLRIEQPVPNLLGNGTGRNYFAISPAALNTELYLLRENEQLAQDALDEVRDRHGDAWVAPYTPASMAAQVSISPVAGTEGLVRFALTGPDPVSLPAVVEAYATKYNAEAEKSTSKRFSLQQQDLEQRVEEARDLLVQAEGARDDFAQQHEGLNLDRGENPFTQERKALTDELPALEQTDVEDRNAWRRVEDALGDVGITAELTAKGDVVLTGLADEKARHAALAASALVSGLPGLRDHPEIKRLRDEEAQALADDRRAAEQGMLESHERRVEARREIDRARERRGWVTARELERELREIHAREAHLDGVRTALERARTEEETCNVALSAYQRLERDVVARQRAYDAARQQLADFTSMYLSSSPGSAAGEDAGPRLRIVIQGSPSPPRQVAPRVALVVGMTLAAALATGLGLAFLLEFLDDTIRSKEDFDRYLGLPFLGFVPRISAREHDSPDLAAEAKPGSGAAEAFRAVRTSILFSRVDAPVRTLLITSAGPGEGKTTLATNLAVTFARKKGPVLLVDADLRRPRVGKALGLEDGRGLSNVLVGSASLDDVVRPTSVDGLFVVTSGPIPPNPAELLHGERMNELLRAAAERYVCVVVDTPPLLAVSDARVLAGRVDGVYMVVSLGRTSRRMILRAVESLTSIGSEISGAVLNNVTGSTGTYGDYSYYAREYRHE